MSRKPEPITDPEKLGETWRGQMSRKIEGVPSAVWKRVFRLRKIDLTRPQDATGLQIYRLLYRLMERGDLCLSVGNLKAHVDDHLDAIFRTPG